MDELLNMPKAEAEEALASLSVAYRPDLDDIPPGFMWNSGGLAIGPVLTSTATAHATVRLLNLIHGDDRLYAEVRQQLSDVRGNGVTPTIPARAVLAAAARLYQRDYDVKQELHKLRTRQAARDLLDAEQHAKAWREPADHGDLAAELALPEEPEAWRLRGLLGLGHNAILVAGRKAGKTTMVNNLVRAYVDGEPFLDQFEVTPTDAAVAVFNYEVDQRQYRRWLRDAGIKNVGRVHVLHLRGRSLPLTHPRIRDWVTGWLRARNIGLWILDPYSRAYVGSVDNGSDESQVGAFVDNLDVIKAESGVGELVMPVHTPKARAEAGEENAIGSQRLEAWADGLWYLTRDLVTGLRFLRAEGRDVDVAEQQLTFDPTTRALTLGGSSRATARQDADLEALVAYVAEHPGCTGRDIEGALGWGADRRGRAVARAQGRVQVDKGKNRAHLHYPIDLSAQVLQSTPTAPVQSGALLSIESTTAHTARAGDPQCLGCGRPTEHLNPNSWLCANCESEAA